MCRLHWILPLLAFAAYATAHAQSQSVHRCIGTHGEIVFSGLPCGTEIAPDSHASSPSPGEGDRSAAPVCPASTEALRTLLADALARRDANAIAGVLRWDGVGGGEARQRLRELADLAAQPLLGVDMNGDEAAPGAPTDSTAATLTVRTGSSESGGTREHEFRIRVNGGCHWLDW